MKDIKFRITIQTEEAQVYSQTMPPMPIPRAGEDVFCPNPALGWWRVLEVLWSVPQMDALEPSMWVNINVEWSPINQRAAPVYNEEMGWIKDDHYI